MKLEELKARLAAVMQSMADLTASDMNAEAVEKFDALEAEAAQIKGHIARIEKAEALQAEAAAMQAGTGRRTQASAPARVEVRDNRADDPTGGFNNLAEFALAVKAASGGRGAVSVDERLKVLSAPSNYHRETGSTDGYMVPPQQSDKIIELMFGEPDLLAMVDSEDTSGNSVQFLADETTPWGATGIQAYWGPEAGQLTASRLETEGREVKLHKLHALVSATEELLEDAPRLNGRLTKGAARAMNWKANEALIYGTGAGQPLGFFTAGSRVEVAKETSQTAVTLNSTNISKMFSRHMNPGRSVWMINQDVLPQLVNMTIGNQPIYTAPNQGIKDAPGGFLMGRPVMFSDQCKTLGTVGDVMLIDPMGYYMVKKAGGIKFASSIHLYFDYDVQAFKWTFRLGGQPYLRSAVTPANGSNTRSHFVTLATRA